MLAIVPSATLHGLDGRCHPGRGGRRARAARVHRSSGWPTPRSRRRGNGSAARSATPASSTRRGGSPSTSRRRTCARRARRSTSRSRSASCSGRSRSGPGPDEVALIGELSLGGEVRPVPGILPMVAALARRGLRRVVVASAAVAEARLVEGIEVVGVGDASRGGRGRPGPPEPSRRRPRRSGSSSSARRGRRRRGGARAAGRRAARARPVPGPGRGPRPGRGATRPRDRAGRRSRPAADRAAGVGQDAARADDPGAPATARRSRGADRDRRRVGGGRGADRRSCAGGRPSEPRTTRCPTPRMVGGGPHLSPGEVTRADQGVLFLDELPEFDRDVLEALRQPMEEGRVAISRAGRATSFPARFQLVAAMNPCPCGFAGTSGSSVRLPDAASRSGTSDASPARSATGSTCGSRCRASRRWPSFAGRTRKARRSSPPGSRPRVASRTDSAERLAQRPPHAAGALRDGVPPGAPRGTAGRGPRRARTGQRPRHGAPAAGRTDDRRPRGRRGGRARSSRRGRLVSAGRRAARRRPRRADMLGVGVDGPIGAASRQAEDARTAAQGPTAPSTPGIEERDAWAVLAGVRGLGPVGFGRSLRRYGSAVEILREAASNGGPARLVAAAEADGTDARRGRADLTPELAAAIAAAAEAADRDPRPHPGAGPRRRDGRGPALPVAAWPRSTCRRTSCTCSAIRPRWTARRPSPSSARAGRPDPVGPWPRGWPRAWSRSAPRSCPGSRSGSTARPTRRRSTPAGRRSRSSAPATRSCIPGRTAGWPTSIVASGGAVVSELGPDVGPSQGTFPRRNRIISGLADATVVVEAPARSGALITASWALEQGRECFLVPGAIDAPASAGCLAFLREFPERHPDRRRASRSSSTTSASRTTWPCPACPVTWRPAWAASARRPAVSAASSSSAGRRSTSWWP